MKKILIADELSFCRQLLAFVLEQNGYEVVAVEDGLGLIDALKREKPDLVIMETRLPKIDGIAVLRIMRGSPDFKDIPVFMVTIVESRQQIVQAVQIGVQEYILKSRFDLAACLARIEKCIGGRMPLKSPAGAALSGGRAAVAAVAEVWDEVEMPPASAASTIEIAGDMEEAVSFRKEG